MKNWKVNSKGARSFFDKSGSNGGDLVASKRRPVIRGSAPGLKVLSSSNIGRCDGKGIIFKSTKIFTGTIEENFTELNEPSKKTAGIAVRRYVLPPEMSLSEVVDEFKINLHQLALTQHQVIRYSQKNNSLFKQDINNWLTYYLIKYNKDYLVAGIPAVFPFMAHSKDDMGLSIYLEKYKESDSWFKNNNSLLVAPAVVDLNILL